MDCLTFISKLVDTAAWPVAAIALVLLLRKEIADLLPILKRIKAGPLEAEFVRIEKELEEAKEIAQSADEKAQIIATKLDEADELTDAPTQHIALSNGLNDLELKVLRAMANSSFAMRSITGISKTTGLDKAAVSMVLNDLIKKGLVKQTKNQAKQLRWYASTLGRAAAGES